MPTVDEALFSSLPHSVKKYLSISPRPVVFSAQVDGAPFRDSVSGAIHSFAFTNSTGITTDVKAGYTLEVGTTAGAKDIGLVRVRKPIAGNIIYIAESGINIQNGYYVTVRQEYRPWKLTPRLVEIKSSGSVYADDFTEYHDYDIAYSGQNANIIPKANVCTRMNSGWPIPAKLAGFVDEGQAYRTVRLDSTPSFAIGSATIQVINWNVADGTIIEGSTSTGYIIATFPAGFRYVTLTVTDSNGASGVLHIPIWAHDDSFPPITNFQVNNDTRESWRSMSFEFFGEDNALDHTVFPIGSAVCYWEDATFGDSAAPEGYIDQYLGWSTRDSDTLKIGNRSNYSVETTGLGGWLDRFESFPQTLRDTGLTPARWHEMQNITIDKSIYYILYSYSNALTIGNLFFSAHTAIAENEEIKNGSIFAQIVELTKAYCGVPGFDSLNGLWLREHFCYLDEDDRLLREDMLTLTKAMWEDESGLSFTIEAKDTIPLVEVTGSYFSGGSSTLLQSKWYGPGASSKDSELLEYQRLSAVGDPQAKLNRLVGHHGARLNSYDGEISISLVGNMDFVEPAWNIPVKLIWNDESLRGIQVDKQYLVKGVSVSHSNDKNSAPKRITWSLEPVTSGPQGITVPVEEDVIPPVEGGSTTPAIPIPSIITSGSNSFDVRQNSLEPWYLEKSNNLGSTWTVFANLLLNDLFTQVRQNPDDPCILEYYTGYLNDEQQWIPFADLSGCVGAPTGRDEDIERAKCNSAANVVDVIETLHDQIIVDVTAGKSALQVATGISTLLAGVKGGPVSALSVEILMPLMQAAVALTTGEKSSLQCHLYCANLDDGTYDDASMISLLDYIGQEVGDVWSLITAYMGWLGVQGLNESGALSTITNADCSACTTCPEDATWCYTFDFENTDEMEWFKPPLYGSGTYTTSVGWESTGGIIHIRRDIDPRDITMMSINLTNVSGAGFIKISGIKPGQINPYEIIEIPTVLGQQSYYWIGRERVQSVIVRVVEDEAVTLPSLTLFGMGLNQFGEDVCDTSGFPGWSGPAQEQTNSAAQSTFSSEWINPYHVRCTWKYQKGGNNYWPSVSYSILWNGLGLTHTSIKIRITKTQYANAAWPTYGSCESDMRPAIGIQRLNIFGTVNPTSVVDEGDTYLCSYTLSNNQISSMYGEARGCRVGPDISIVTAKWDFKVVEIDGEPTGVE